MSNDVMDEPVEIEAIFTFANQPIILGIFIILMVVILVGAIYFCTTHELAAYRAADKTNAGK